MTLAGNVAHQRPKELNTAIPIQSLNRTRKSHIPAQDDIQQILFRRPGLDMKRQGPS